MFDKLAAFALGLILGVAAISYPAMGNPPPEFTYRQLPGEQISDDGFWIGSDTAAATITTCGYGHLRKAMKLAAKHLGEDNFISKSEWSNLAPDEKLRLLADRLSQKKMDVEFILKVSRDECD